MSPTTWWPPVAVVAMIGFGLVVGKGAAPVDDWFHASHQSPLRVLHYLSNPLVLAAIGGIVIGAAVFRRWWRLVTVAVVFPPTAYLLVQFIKPFFGRTKGGGLAYPSGHITLTTVVVGLGVLAAGGALWAVLVAIIYIVLAMVGVGSTFHYFTDTVGGVLLGSAIVCVAALITRHDLTRVNPTAI